MELEALTPILFNLSIIVTRVSPPLISFLFSQGSEDVEVASGSPLPGVKVITIICYQLQFSLQWESSCFSISSVI